MLEGKFFEILAEFKTMELKEITLKESGWEKSEGAD